MNLFTLLSKFSRQCLSLHFFSIEFQFFMAWSMVLLFVHNFNFIISNHSALLFADLSVWIVKREVSWPDKTILLSSHTFLKGPACSNESGLAQLVSEHWYVILFILCLPVSAWSWQVGSSCKSCKFWTTQPHSQPKSKARGNHNPCGTISLGEEQVLLRGWVWTSSSLRFHLQRFFCS